MTIGNLEFAPVREQIDLVAPVVDEALSKIGSEEIYVSEIDASLSDTAAFCEFYNFPIEKAANCVILEASKGDRKWLAACVVSGAARADVNGLARRTLEARKVSFAPREVAVEKTKMEFGAIGPIGLPADMPILIDKVVTEYDYVIIGSGVRGSKLLLPGRILAQLPNATVLENLGKIAS